MRGQRDKVAFFFRRADAFFVMFAFLLLFSCGLPTSDYLYPPANFSALGDSPVQLVPDTRNIDIDELFKGYDIYYRIFDSQEKANESSTKLSSKLTSGNITSVASLEGYYVLVKENDDSAPLIPVSDDNTYRSFDLHLYSDETWTITADDNEIVLLYYIFRNKSGMDTADFCSRSQYLEGDPDYEGDGISGNVDDSVYIVFFAVAYGISSSSIGSGLYSDPIVLLPIQYTPMGGS